MAGTAAIRSQTVSATALEHPLDRPSIEINMSTTIVRFAPSPTGKIHIGNLRPALINWLFARREGGKFMLRLDDTDQERSKEEFAQAIRDDLTWLGLDWDIEAKQSDRFDRYNEIADRLKAEGRLYPCYETPDELDRKRKRQLARGKPPVYDRAALSLSDEEQAALEAEGRMPHWRFRLSSEQDGSASDDVTWTDLIRGEASIALASMSDPVLIRGDGTFLYTLPSVIDDIDFKITHVIRGEDHVANTGVQLDLFRTIDPEHTPPHFAHHNLLVGADGQALAKRLGALSIESFREDGFEPIAILSHAATIGSSDPVQVFPTVQAIADNFAFEKLSRSPARFDVEELASLNARLLHTLPYTDVKERLEALGADGGEAFWLAARENISKLHEITDWWQLINAPVEPDIADADFAATARDLLPDDPWDNDTWKNWTESVKAETGRKGRDLFMPLRLALTGMSTGPEMARLMPLIGREKTAARLSGQKA